MDTIKAVVQKVFREGKHGPFAVATSEQLEGSVTFSLEPTVWEEKEWPEEGFMVFLGEIRQKRAGWRAKKGRFWKPSDEQIQQTERSRQMIQFLYPTSLQFPVDGVCSIIVKALEERNWQIPGIDVEFHEYGSGEQKFRHVSQITSQDFKLRFGRKQHTMPGGQWNDIAAVTEIVIPKKELHIYNDESGPTFYLYVGNDWEQDRDQFMNALKVHSKLDGRPKIYLRYSGACRCGGITDWPHTHAGRRSPLLEHTNDLGREYDPEGDEPTCFQTQRVLEEYEQYLEQVILKRIVSYPIPIGKIDTFVSPEPMPFPDAIGSLFCFGEYDDEKRIKQGKVDPNDLDPADRYGLIGSGLRLISHEIPSDDSVPPIAHEGFCWCGIGEVTAETNIDSLEIPGYHRWSNREQYVFRVNPNRANGIYIADHAPYERRRKELGQAMQNDRDRFTDAEVADFTRARARTIIPISEYQGGYEQPVVLINRELSLDEVEVVSGPHHDRY